MTTLHCGTTLITQIASESDMVLPFCFQVPTEPSWRIQKCRIWELHTGSCLALLSRSHGQCSTMVTVEAFHSWFSHHFRWVCDMLEPISLALSSCVLLPSFVYFSLYKEEFSAFMNKLSAVTCWDVSHHFRVSWEFYFHSQDALVIWPIYMGRSCLFKSCSTPTFLHSMCPC